MMTKEERKKYHKQWYDDNKKRILERQKRYNDTHQKERSTYGKAYRDEHKEEIAESKKQYYENNKEQRIQYNKQYHNSHKETTRKRSRKRTIIKHGVTPEQHTEIFNKQQGCCMICGRHQSELKLALAIDHDHTTGKIRGLLCGKCNRGIGYLNDDVNLLLKAIEYLKNNC
jgi:hypothetical protein